MTKEDLRTAIKLSEQIETFEHDIKLISQNPKPRYFAFSVGGNWESTDVLVDELGDSKTEKEIKELCHSFILGYNELCKKRLMELEEEFANL